MYSELQNKIESAWENKDLLKDISYSKAVVEVLELLDKGNVRISEKTDGKWKLNEWLK